MNIERKKQVKTCTQAQEQAELDKVLIIIAPIRPTTTTTTVAAVVATARVNTEME